MLVRRFIFAIITAFAGNLDGGLTVSLVVIEIFLFSFYLITVKPQETNLGNRVELISEVLLLYCFFGIMSCLTVDDPKKQYKVGWLSVSAIITLVLACILYLLSDSVSRLLEWIKTKLLIRRR